MKIKSGVFFLFLSSSALAYNQLEMTQLIHQQIKNHSFLNTFPVKKKKHTLNWQALQFPKTYEKFNVVVMKNSNTLMFVYTPYSSNINIYKSNDTGKHWRLISTPNVMNIHHLISIDENRLLLAGDNKIYLSKDRGENWILTAIIDESCDKLFSPTQDLILLTTNFNDSTPGLYRSVDGGKHFSPARLGINEGLPFFALGGNRHILLAGSDNIFFSTNNGLLWRSNSNWANKLFSFVAINHQSDIYLVVNNNLYKTEETGTIWEPLNKDLGSVASLKIDAKDRLYIIVQKEGYYLYRSMDNGQTWEWLHQFNQNVEMHLLNNGKILINTNEGLMLSDESQLVFTKLAELPHSNSTNAKVFAFNNSHFFAMALPYLSPLYSSEDNGKTWMVKRDASVMDVLAFKNQIVTLEYNGDQQQVMVSDDLGNSWYLTLQINNNYCYLLSNQHDRLIINCKNDNYFTQDLIHWSLFKIPKKNSLSTSYYSGKIIYITDGNSILCSSDGLNWKYLLSDLNQHRAYISGYKDELLVIAINKAGIIKMMNGGLNWDLINNGLTNFDFTNLIVIDANIYMVSTNHGIFYTQNGGKEWTPENHGLNNLMITSLSLYHNTLLAGTEGSGIFKASVGSIIEQKK